MPKVIATWVLGLALSRLSIGGTAEGTMPAGHPPVPGAAQAATMRIHGRIQALASQCERDPEAWEPRAELGQLYLRFGYGREAAKLLDEAIALKPGHAPLYQLAGQAHNQLQEYDRAIALWRKALELDPSDTRPQAWIASAEKWRADEARLAELDDALQKNPAEPEALLARARLLSERGKWPSALADLEALLKLKPDDTEALGLAGMAHYRQGHLDDAIRFWTQAVEATPEGGPYREWLERAQRSKALRAELANVEAQLRESPDDGRLHLQAGKLWAKLGEWRKATEVLGEAAKLLPKDAEARKTHALALFRVGQMDEAVAELEACTKLAPANPDYPRLLDTVKRARDMHRAMKKRP